MNFIPLIFYSVAFFLLVIYVMIIWRSTNALKRNSRDGNFESETSQFRIDIIISYRNEEKHLPFIASDLDKQTHQNFRVIWVNDHSTDNSKAKIHGAYNKPNALFIDAKSYGKKAAIKEAIQITDADLIVFTDADCHLPSTWLSGYAQIHSKHKKGLYFGAVVNSTSSKLQNFFALEFLSLMGTGMGMALNGSPVYMNGANYAISSDLLNIFEKQDGQNLSSGDDVFLLHAVKKHIGSKYIIPGATSRVTVTTPAPSTLKEFISQRIRWGGKAKKYKDAQTFFLAVLIFTIAFVQVFALFYWPALQLSILIWLVKIGADYYALWRYTGKWGKRELRTYILPTSILYPFYILFASISGVFSPKQKW